MARLRVDGLPIEHAQYATAHTGPMSWITSGKLDAVMDIRFPHHPDEEVDLKAIIERIGQNVATIANGHHTEDSADGSAQPNATKSTAAAVAANVLEAAQVIDAARIVPGQHRLARPPLRAPGTLEPEMSPDAKLARRHVTIDIDLRFRDLKAAVPVFTSDLSVRNNALIRPIVAFINANRTLVPIHCHVAADLSDFDGSWTVSGGALARA